MKMMKFPILFIVLLVLETSYSAMRPCTFHAKCTCGIGPYQEANSQYIVNCTDTGFTDTAVLQHIPNQTEVSKNEHTELNHIRKQIVNVPSPSINIDTKYLTKKN